MNRGRRGPTPLPKTERRSSSDKNPHAASLSLSSLAAIAKGGVGETGIEGVDFVFCFNGQASRAEHVSACRICTL